MLPALQESDARAFEGFATLPIEGMLYTYAREFGHGMAMGDSGGGDDEDTPRLPDAWLDFQDESGKRGVEESGNGILWDVAFATQAVQ